MESLHFFKENAGCVLKTFNILNIIKNIHILNILNTLSREQSIVLTHPFFMPKEYFMYF